MAFPIGSNPTPPTQPVAPRAQTPTAGGTGAASPPVDRFTPSTGGGQGEGGIYNLRQLGQLFQNGQNAIRDRMRREGVPDSVGADEALRAQRGVTLSDEERRLVQQASGTLDRLAGADGLWNRGDVGNNVRQLEDSGDLSRAVQGEIGRRVDEKKQGRLLPGRMVINGHMRRHYGDYYQQGMGQARGMAQGQLSQGLDQAGVAQTAGHDAARAQNASPQAWNNAGRSISRAEMEQFQSAMAMLQQRSREQGLPAVSFPNGIPSEFLKAVGEGRSPQEALRAAGAQITWSTGDRTTYGPNGPAVSPRQP